MGLPLVPPGNATQAVQPHQDARWRFERQRDRQDPRQRKDRLPQAGEPVPGVNETGQLIGRRIDTTA